MNICIRCKVEMVCCKTGFNARWGASHCYRGDKFRCPKCGLEVGVMNPANFQSDAPLTDDDIQMPQVFGGL